METQTLIRLVVGLSLTVIVLFFAARRVLWLVNLIREGQPASGRMTTCPSGSRHRSSRSSARRVC